MIELQKQLDAKKWYESQFAERDLSGEMFYCQNCKYKSITGCTSSQEEREEKRLCARAYLSKNNE